MKMASKKVISVSKVIGSGYNKFWNCKKRYRVVKGSRASKKSTTAALNIIFRMMQYPEANTLVIRQTASTLKDSCFAQLLWAVDRLRVAAWWKARVSPLELEYLPTGQKILFRGLDDAMKVTSITVRTGVLCWGWVEEAYEIDEEDFNRLDESLRGDMPPGYFIQWTITFNPWSASSWLKARFFDIPKDNVFTATTTYTCNEWLTNEDRAVFEDMRLFDPKRYKVAGLGDWGIENGQFFDVFNEAVHVVKPFKIPDGWIRYRAMDWGTAHPYSVLWIAVDYDGNSYVYRELYGWGGKPNVGTKETARQVAEHIVDAEPHSEEIYLSVLDNACWAATGVTGPTIAEEINEVLYAAGRGTFDKCSKGRAEGANAIRERLIGNTDSEGKQKPALYFFANCMHIIRTLPMLAHDKHNPEAYDTQGEDHSTDSLAYYCMARPWKPSRPVEKTQKDGYRRRNTQELDNGWTV